MQPHGKVYVKDKTMRLGMRRVKVELATSWESVHQRRKLWAQKGMTKADNTADELI